ncbi:MAG: tetratricopeptide repeat protein [Candidatus Wallbacteria bacterium]|nr:tetratricopeptide repeat protein [Candidatus Wallbacteria bacterium]
MRRISLTAVALLAATALAAGPVTAQAPGSAGDGGTYRRGLDLVAAGKADEGINLLAAAASKASGPEADAADTALGSAYLMAGKVREARARLKGPIDRSAYVPALVEMARTYLYAPPFEPKTALGYLKTAIGREPKNVEVLLELARAHVNDENQDQAVAIYKLLIEEVAPKDVRGYFGLGDVYVARKRFDKAKPLFRQALQLAPQDPEAYFRMANMVMSDEGDSNHLAKAIGWYERAVEIGRDNPRYHGALIYAYYRNGNNLAAAPVLTRLEEFAPQSSVTHWARGVFSEYQGQMSRALELYKAAVALDTQNVYANYSLGVFLSGKRNADFILIGADRDWKYLPHRDIDRSITHLKAALALEPAFPFAGRARGLIDDLQSTATEQPVDSSEMEQMRQRLDDYYRTKASMF